MPKLRWIAAACLCAFTGFPAIADDIRPEAPPVPDESPLADEKCIERCDVESDRCMLASEGDPGKVQVCDDKYSECLQKCEGG